MDDATTIASPPTTAQGPQVLVYVRDDDSAGVIRQALSDLGTSAISYRTGRIDVALQDLKAQPSPRLLIVDVGGEAEPAGQIRELVGMCEPSTAVIVIGDTNDIRVYRGVREAGAQEYFFKPLVLDLVSRTCREVLTGTKEEQGARSGQAIFVVGVRGGCGASTIAARLAWRLSQSPPRPVLLMDLDLNGGDIALQVDAAPNHALSEALAEPDRVDDLFIERGLAHVTNRLDVLASLEPLEAEVRFEPSSAVELVERLKRRYRYVVAEVPPFSAPRLNDALHRPGIVLLVSDGRLVSARDVGRWRQLLGEHSASRTILHILNMGGAPGSLPAAEFARAAGHAPDVVIPYAREVGAAGLLGLKAEPQSPHMDKGLEPIIAMLSGEPLHHKRSLFERVRG
jgi:pilus assembly protein CpaE